ncbi:MAG: Gfo/Idh/MocA family oxidoreductase [Pirellulaceae bacterium]
MIRIGIIGCGRILAAHLRGYRLLREAGVDDFQITALCSRTRSDAQMYIQRDADIPQRPAVSNLPGDPLAVGDEYLSDFQPGVPVDIHTDYRELIESGSVDAINDYTIHSLHHQIAADAFSHGLHLMTQKPLGITVRAAQQMCAQAEAADRVFGVFENARYAPANRHLLWAIGAGLLGTPQILLMGNVGTWWVPNQIVANTPWRHQRIEGGGISVDLGVHHFNAARMIAGEIHSIQGQTSIQEPTRVQLDADGSVIRETAADADDTYLATFRSQAGVEGNLFASWSGAGGSTIIGPGVVLHGSKGRAVGPRFYAANGEDQPLADLYAAGASPEQQATDFPLALDDSFALTQHDWLEAIRTQSQPQTSGREGLQDLACAFSILESDLAGRRVEVNEVLNGDLGSYQDPINGHFQILPLKKTR